MADTKELAEGYVSRNDTQYGAGQFLLDRLKIESGEHVLDVGCGPGNLTEHIADLAGNGKVAGIDPSEERIGIAQGRARKNLTFSVGKAEELNFEDAQFDVVFVNSTFHWVQDQPKAAREFARVLKTGGRVGISGGSGDYTTHQERIKADVLSREPYRNYPEKSPPRFLKRVELERLLDQAGFESDIVTNKIIKKVSSPEAMVDWLDTSSSGKTYGGISVDLRPQARQEMLKEWEKLMTQDGISMEIELLVTVATKR